MTESLAERALCEVARRLRAIRTEDGYSTDAGLTVLRARRKLSEEECPAAVVWDMGETVNGTRGASGKGSMDVAMTVHVECHAPADQECTGFLLEKLKADVKRAVMSPSLNGGLADDAGQIGILTYVGTSCFERQDGAATESITAQFTITLTERFGDPTSSNP